MLITQPYEWSLYSERPGKRIWRRFNIADDAVEYMEEWFEAVPLQAAAQQRELAGGTKDIKALAVVPDSELSRAIREGWVNDDAAWNRWANDANNRNLRILDGSA